VAAAALLLASCGGGGGGDASDRTPSVVTGTIEQITVNGRTARFSLRAGGRTYVVHMTRDIDYGFDPRHLLSHRDTGQAVRCHIVRRGDMLVALDVLDA
jgi:hypothetical protein